MCSGLQCHAALRYLRKCLLHRFRCRRHVLFQNDFACFIQNTVERPAIAKVHTNREFVSFENHVSIYPNSASLFHSRSPFLCLEHVEHWERIASRGDRPSHPICETRISSVLDFLTTSRLVPPSKRVSCRHPRRCGALARTCNSASYRRRSESNPCSDWDEASSALYGDEGKGLQDLAARCTITTNARGGGHCARLRSLSFLEDSGLKSALPRWVVLSKPTHN